MKVAVCDDEKRFRDDIAGRIDKLYSSLDVIVDSFSNGRKLIEAFDRKPYDLIFLDIEMPEMDGITLAKKLREKSDKVFIVFLTGHVEYALQGYEVNALRYLTKPVQEEKLIEVMRFVSDRLTEKRQIRIKVDGEELFINVSDIIYMEAENQYIMIYTVDGNYLVRYNISDYEKELKSDGFYKAHRSYLVSLGKVKKLSRGNVIMEGDISVPVSRSAAAGLKEALYAYLEEKAF